MSRETSPLLAHPPETEPETPVAPPPATDRVATTRHPKFLRAIIVIFSVCFVAEIGTSLIGTADTRLFEMAVCRDYYREHDPSVIGEPPLSYVDEGLCKVKEIQTRLAYLRATRGLVMTLPGIFLTLPYGHLSDKIGRKVVFFLTLLGQVLDMLATAAIYGSRQKERPTLTVIGGGNRVLIACLNSVIVDVAPPSTFTTVFYAFGAGGLLIEAAIMPVGAWLLLQDLWLPLKAAVTFIILPLVMVAALPETHVPKKTSFQDEDLDREGENTLPSPPKDRFSLPAMIRQTVSKYRDAVEGFKGPAKGARVCLVLLFMSSFTARETQIFPQYASKVLDWPIAKAGYVISVKRFVSLLLYASLAVLSRLVGRRGEGASLLLNKRVVVLSFATMGVGALMLGLSRDVVTLVIASVFDSAGYGVSLSLHGILAAFADPASTGELFAGAALVELLAGLSGSFVFAGFFDLGLGLKIPRGIGLPYFVGAILYAFSTTHSAFML
ncbi:major facilitator superfamily transporter [Colletotrichum sojae]|uniref:Major facilitator superfamily transporter n=1 Tax=Colletotrichum sojae TaxID=2175907 RepID=A0A8H6J747_9PEZI|nr:major facilitator superfamily transporter [Colletotrichum sojae]